MVGRHCKIFSSHTVKVPLDLVIETMVQVDQRYSSYEAVYSVFRSGYVPGGIVPSLKTTKNRHILFMKLLWRKPLFSELLHAKNSGGIRLCEIVL